MPRDKDGVAYWRNLRCDGCERSCRYRDFKVFDSDGFAEARNWLWVESDDPEKWRYKRRGTVLGLMHAHKKTLWEQHTTTCPHRKED